MRLVDLGSLDAPSALAAEEAALESANAGAGEPAWLTWTASGLCAVLGTARPAGGDLFLERLKADGIAVLRRRSGGGTVLLGPGSPVVTAISPGSEGIRQRYRSFCDALAAALRRLGLEAGFEPPADLTVGGRKVAGLAQRRRRRAALVTAAVLAASLAEESALYLPEPPAADAPAYRAGRAHGEFMTSLGELGVGDAAESFPEALRAELAARGASPGELSAAERGRAADIRGELADPAWVFRL